VFARIVANVVIVLVMMMVIGGYDDSGDGYDGGSGIGNHGGESGYDVGSSDNEMTDDCCDGNNNEKCHNKGYCCTDGSESVYVGEGSDVEMSNDCSGCMVIITMIMVIQVTRNMQVMLQ
jgi:hypothetical protein